MLKKMFIALTFFLYIQERKKRNFIWERCTVSKHGEGINDFVNRIVIQDMVLWKSSIKKWYYEQYYEDLQDLLELTPKKDVLFIIGDWNAKVGSQETPGVTGKFGLGMRNEAGQRLIEFCQENALVVADTLFQQHKRRLYT